MTTDRWTRLLDTEPRPRPSMDVLLDEVAKLVAADLGRWPLPTDPPAPPSPRPSPEVFTEALRLARWDLERDTAAYDDYFRNGTQPPAEKPALLFVARWLVEVMLSLGEHSPSVTRRHMVDCLQRVGALLK